MLKIQVRCFFLLVKYMSKDEVIAILDASDYYGDASAMAMKIIDK